MASTFDVEIVTPDKKFFEGTAEMVIVRTIEGDVAVLKNHENYVAPLDIGIVKIKIDGVFKEATIASGFIQIDKQKTTIITDAAEWPEEIDIERARKAKEKAEGKLKNKSNTDLVIAELQLRKALNRIRVVEKRD